MDHQVNKKKIRLQSFKDEKIIVDEIVSFLFLFFAFVYDGKVQNSFIPVKIYVK